MIQRKQTLFLLLALVGAIACLMMPVGSYEPEGMGAWHGMSNWFISDPQSGEREWTPLFFILLMTCPVTLGAIFTYKNRMLQAKLCIANVVLLLLWYVDYIAYAFFLGPEKMTFHFAFAACMPLLAIILNVMARAGIMADERLVKAADRIR